MRQRGKDTKPHIGIFGRRNNGKSSLINALAGQDIAIVSDIPGTTTDPVRKSIEIHTLGPVILVDTAGIDDSGELGLKRIERTNQILKIIDLAVLVIAENLFGNIETDLIVQFKKNETPFIILHNKSDQQTLAADLKAQMLEQYQTPILEFSSIRPLPGQIEDLIEALKSSMPESAMVRKTLVGDLIRYGDVVLLITPIDIEAPEGRLILPQVQVIRDILDHDGVAVVVKEREVDAHIRRMTPRPALVITDSQVFPKADAAVPKDIPLTSFSILLARQKGNFEEYLKGTPQISKLRDGDRLLILESCTHHATCDDIGRVKIPRWLENFTGKKLEYDVVAGLSAITRNISEYALVIQCGGCMITRKQLFNRLKSAIEAGVPVTNYGMAIAYVHGIYHRAVEPFTHERDETGDYL